MTKVHFGYVVPVSTEELAIYLYAYIPKSQQSTISLPEAEIQVKLHLTQEEATAPVVYIPPKMYILDRKEYRPVKRRSLKNRVPKFLVKGKFWYYSHDELLHQFCVEANKNWSITSKDIERFFKLLSLGRRNEAKSLLIAKLLLEVKAWRLTKRR